MDTNMQKWMAETKAVLKTKSKNELIRLAINLLAKQLEMQQAQEVQKDGQEEV